MVGLGLGLGLGSPTYTCCTALTLTLTLATNPDPNPNPNPTQCTDVAEAAGRRPWLVDLGDLNGKGWVPFFAAVPALLAFILVFLDDGSPWLPNPEPKPKPRPDPNPNPGQASRGT